MRTPTAREDVLMYVDSDRYYYPAQLSEAPADITDPPTWTYEPLTRVKGIFRRAKHPATTTYQT